MKLICDFCKEERESEEFVRKSRAKRRASMLLGSLTNSNVCVHCLKYADNSASHSRGKLLNSIKSFREALAGGTIPNGFEDIEALARASKNRCADESRMLMSQLKSLHEFHQRATLEMNVLRDERMALMMQQYKQRRSAANYHISKFHVREMVFHRSGNKCAACGAVKNLTVDHIIPVLHGGTDDLENLQALCGPCNSKKGASK
jgi:hypothetical protein